MPDDRPPRAPDPEALLFVYGTLKRGFSNPWRALLERGAELVGPATLRGRMFHVRGEMEGGYPGVVLDPVHGYDVHGELHRLREPAAELLGRLDAYEGCAPDDPEPRAFERCVVEVVASDSRERLAQAYLYRRAVDGLEEIPSGVFPLTGGR